MTNIRKAQSSDQEFIVQAQVAMAWETEELKLDPGTVKKGVAAVFADPHKGAYYVAEVAGKPIAVLLTVPEWSDWRNGTVLWIHSVYVAPECRGQGVYKKMYEYLHGMVSQSGGALRGLRLYVDKRNTRAQKVYQKLGMSAEHYEMFEWLNS